MANNEKKKKHVSRRMRREEKGEAGSEITGSFRGEFLLFKNDLGWYGQRGRTIRLER